MATWSRGYKPFLCSTRSSMKFFLFINVKMPVIAGILTFRNRKKNIIGLPEPKKKLKCLIFLYLLAFKISCSTELSMKKV